MSEPINIHTAIAASDGYQLLSKCLLLPTKELAAGILGGSLAHDFLKISHELGVDDDLDEIKTAFETESLGQEGRDVKEYLSVIRQEYTRLFSHPENSIISLYESQFGKWPDAPTPFVNPVAIEVEKHYKAAGFSYPKQSKEPPDHMAVELEFLSFLYLRIAMAIDQGEKVEISLRKSQLEEFRKSHLLVWAPDFFNCCVLKSHEPFFQIYGKIGHMISRSA